MELGKWSDLEKSSAYQEGIKMFREGRVPADKSVECLYIVKTVNKREFNNYYDHYLGYVHLGEEGNKIKVGFLMGKDNWNIMSDVERNNMRLADNFESVRVKEMHNNLKR